MLFAIDSQAAKARHEEMIREAANARLAHKAMKANRTGSLLQRLVNLLSHVARTQTSVEPANTHQPTLANAKVS